MSGSYSSRAKGVADWDDKWDPFDDIADGGLADTDAARAVFNVRKKVVRDGISIFYVDNNNVQISYTITWPEVAALAFGQNPSDPRIQAAQGWAMAQDAHGPFPYFQHPNAFRDGAKPRIDVQEAKNALTQGQASWGRDPHTNRVIAVCRQITGGR